MGRIPYGEWVEVRMMRGTGRERGKERGQGEEDDQLLVQARHVSFK
jgi:hypothetical protein